MNHPDQLPARLRSLADDISKAVPVSAEYHARVMASVATGRSTQTLRRLPMRAVAVAATALVLSTAGVTAALLGRMPLPLLSAPPTPSRAAHGAVIASPTASVMRQSPGAAPTRGATAPGLAGPTRQSQATSAPATSTSPARPAGQPGCDPNRLSLSVSTDRATYAAGQQVDFTLELHNDNAGDCAVPAAGDTCDAAVYVSGPQGAHWSSPPPVCTGAGSPATQPLPPGATVAYTITWNGRTCLQQESGSACMGPPAPPGEYTAFADVRVGDSAVDSGAARFAVQ